MGHEFAKAVASPDRQSSLVCMWTPVRALLCTGVLATLVGAATPVAPAAALAPPRTAPTPPRTVLALGDSVHLGGACRCTPLAPRYAALLAARTGAPVATLNLAHGGWRTTHVRDQLETGAGQAAVRRATTVVLVIGANDYSAPFAAARYGRCVYADCFRDTSRRVKNDAIAIVRRVRALHSGPVTVIVVGYWNVGKDGAVGRAAYGRAGVRAAASATYYANGALHRAAVATGATYVSTYVPFKGPWGRADCTRLLAGDGDHPSAGGHRRIAQALFAARPRG